MYLCLLLSLFFFFTYQLCVINCLKVIAVFKKHHQHLQISAKPLDLWLLHIHFFSLILHQFGSFAPTSGPWSFSLMLCWYILFPFFLPRRIWHKQHLAHTLDALGEYVHALMVITRRYSGANLMLNSSLDKHSGPDFESLLDNYFMPRYMVITRKYPVCQMLTRWSTAQSLRQKLCMILSSF